MHKSKVLAKACASLAWPVMVSAAPAITVTGGDKSNDPALDKSAINLTTTVGFDRNTSTQNSLLPGDIPEILEIVPTGVGPYDRLDLTTSAVNMQIAHVREEAHTNDGYIVRVFSANGGKLQNGNSTPISYSATYNNIAHALLTSGATITNVLSTPNYVNVVKPAKISYVGVVPEEYWHGTYSDTLTYQISTQSGQLLKTSSITLQGTIAQSRGVVVTGVGAWNSLDLGTSAVNMQVFNVRELSNVPSGYQLTLKSENAGHLRNGNFQIPYTATYNNSAVALSTTPVVISSVTSQTSPINVVKPFKITYAGRSNEDMLAGTYSDTIAYQILPQTAGSQVGARGGIDIGPTEIPRTQHANTGQIALQSLTVPVVRRTAATGIGAFDNLSLITAATNVTVGRVTEVSNSPAGYTFTLISTNSGKLVNGANSIPYTATYNGAPVTLSSSGFTLTNLPSQTTPQKVLRDLNISYTGVSPTSQGGGVYSDMLNFVIRDQLGNIWGSSSLTISGNLPTVTTVAWNNPAGGTWHNENNWNPTLVPGAASDAVFGINTPTRSRFPVVQRRGIFSSTVAP